MRAWPIASPAASNKSIRQRSVAITAKMSMWRGSNYSRRTHCRKFGAGMARPLYPFTSSFWNGSTAYSAPSTHQIWIGRSSTIRSCFRVRCPIGFDHINQELSDLMSTSRPWTRKLKPLTTLTKLRTSCRPTWKSFGQLKQRSQRIASLQRKIKFWLKKPSKEWSN
ncbi:hypothetical protein D9M72_557700 [compost metagenome]